jgi:hypothetical protein
MVFISSKKHAIGLFRAMPGGDGPRSDQQLKQCPLVDAVVIIAVLVLCLRVADQLGEKCAP